MSAFYTTGRSSMKALVRIAAIALFLAAGSGAALAHGAHDIAIEMVAPAYVSTGEAFSYLLHVNNGGLGDPAYGIVVTHDLPAQVTFISATSGPFQCSLSKKRLTCAAEQIPFAQTTIEVRVTAPSVSAHLFSSVTVDSVGTTDTSATNNAHSATTIAFDPIACTAATPELVRPAQNAKVASPVTLEWSSTAADAQYLVYVAHGGVPLRLIGTTSEKQMTLDVATGPAQWYVEAASDVCPTQTSVIGEFTSVAAKRRRSVRK